MQMPERDPLLGRTIAGKFVLEALVGGGAMGTVYRAQQVALDKSVAIKILHPDMARDPAFVARFHREAKAASRLDHPSSVRVLDFGEDDGLLYIVMEYLDGRDLLSVMVAEWPLPPGRVASILSQVLAALAVAHDQGIVHRDLKPENIMVLEGTSDDGDPVDVVKVCDFGIATMANVAEDEPGPRLTARGLVMGTPDYMSPEQARGEKLDPRSDLYSVGVILYHLLAGRTPFAAESALGIALKHVTDPVVPPSKHADDVDPVLEKICLRALEKPRDARYASARQMRAELRTVLEAHGASLPPIPSGRTGSGGVRTGSSRDGLAIARPGSGPVSSRPAATVGFEARPDKRAATVGFEARPSSSGSRAPRGTVGFEASPPRSEPRPQTPTPPPSGAIGERVATLVALSTSEPPARPVFVSERPSHDREAETQATPIVSLPAVTKTSSRPPPPGAFASLNSNEIQVMVDGAEPASPTREPTKRRGLFVALALVVIAGAAAAVVLVRRDAPEPAAAPASSASEPATNAPAIESAAPSVTAEPIEPEPVAPEPSADPSSEPSEPTTALVASAKKIAHPKAPTVKTAAKAAAPPPAPSPATTPSATEALVAPAPAPAPTPVAPAPTPTPTPVPVAPAPTPAAPPFDAKSGAVAIGNVSTTNGLTPSSVRNALSHAPFARCYRDALAAKGSPASGTATLHVSISDAGHILSANLTGAGFLPTMKACIEGAARAVSVKNVDTGEASATVTLSFSHK